MAYTDDQLKEISRLYENSHSSLKIIQDLSIQLLSLLSSQDSKEYLSHGFMRRLTIMSECINNIFNIFPPERLDLLDKNELNSVNINLHAFTINLAGSIDNLAWVYVLENNLYTKEKKRKSNLITRHGVGLFKSETQSLLPKEIQTVIQSESIQEWKDKYLTPYRDSLAHRIPLYVPPKVLNEKDNELLEELEFEINNTPLISDENRRKVEDLMVKKNNIGSLCYSMHGSFKELSNGVYFHPQLLNDIKVLENISHPIFDFMIKKIPVVR